VVGENDIVCYQEEKKDISIKFQSGQDQENPEDPLAASMRLKRDQKTIQKYANIHG